MAGKRMMIQATDMVFTNQRIHPNTINNWLPQIDVGKLPGVVSRRVNHFNEVYPTGCDISGPGSALMMEEVDCMLRRINADDKHVRTRVRFNWESGDTKFRVDGNQRGSYATLSLQEYAGYRYAWFDLILGLQTYGSLVLRQPRPLPSFDLVPTIPGMVAYCMKYKVKVNM